MDNTSSIKVVRTNRGFTLIEVLIAVVIVGILVAIAQATYVRHVDNSRRADAQSTLMDFAHRLERCYTVTNSYSECVNDEEVLGDIPRDSSDGHYRIEVDDLRPSTFRLVATPQGVQADRDGSNCSELSLTHTGRKQADGDREDDCWGN